MFCAGGGTWRQVSKLASSLRTSCPGSPVAPSIRDMAPPFKSSRNVRRHISLRHIFSYLKIVPEEGLEPSRLAPHDFESCVYTNSTTPALLNHLCYCNEKKQKNQILFEKEHVAPNTILSILHCSSYNAKRGFACLTNSLRS